MSERLTEHVADWRAAGLGVDRERRLVRNVALTGLVSRNGYRYREAALREALELYADKPVFLDHAPRGARPFERSTRDLVGSIVEPRFEDGRVRADVRVLDTEAGRTFLALAERNGPAVGMSHVVLAERSPDGKHVEKLHDVVCVDAVVFPATTSSLQEGRVGCAHHVERPKPESTEVVGTAHPTGSLEDLLERIDRALPAWCERESVDGISVKRVAVMADRVLVDLRSEDDTERLAIAWSVDGDDVVLGERLDPDETPSSFLAEWTRLRSQLDAIVRERDEFAERVERLETELRLVERGRHVDELLATSGLPAFAADESFRGRLLDAEPDRRRELIAERRHLIDATRHRGPVSPERRSDPTIDVDDRLVHAIRRAA